MCDMQEATLIELAHKFAGSRQISLSRVGFLTANDGKFFDRIRAGGTCTLRTAARVAQYFSDHWPEDLDWPPDIPRPEPSVDTTGKAA